MGFALTMPQAGDLFTSFARTYESRRDAEMSLAEYLDGCRSDPML